MEVFIFTGYRKKILLCILRQRKRHRNKVTGLKFQEEAMDMEKIADSHTLHDGVKIFSLGFGVWQIFPLHTAKCVKAAIRAGYRNIDTAEG